jgi:hypothetical protein
MFFLMQISCVETRPSRPSATAQKMAAHGSRSMRRACTLPGRPCAGHQRSRFVVHGLLCCLWIARVLIAWSRGEIWPKSRATENRCEVPTSHRPIAMKRVVAEHAWRSSGEVSGLSLMELSCLTNGRLRQGPGRTFIFLGEAEARSQCWCQLPCLTFPCSVDPDCMLALKAESRASLCFQAIECACRPVCLLGRGRDLLTACSSIMFGRSISARNKTEYLNKMYFYCHFMDFIKKSDVFSSRCMQVERADIHPTQGAHPVAFYCTWSCARTTPHLHHTAMHAPRCVSPCNGPCDL